MKTNCPFPYYFLIPSLFRLHLSFFEVEKRTGPRGAEESGERYSFDVLSGDSFFTR